MKKLILFFACLSSLALTNSFAQQASLSPSSVKTRKFKLDINSVVKDSTGKVYPYAAWSKLIATHQYTLQAENFDSPSTAFMLINKADLDRKMAVAAGRPTNNTPPRFTPPNESSIVKDSTGMIYPYAAWSNMMQSGEYLLQSKYNGTDSVMYILQKQSPSQLESDAVLLPKPMESENFNVGNRFLPFRDRDINGEKIDLKAMAGKVIVLNFWFIGCPPCRAEIPDLNSIVENYKDNKEVLFVAVCLDQAYEIKDFVKQKPFNYHIIADGRYIAEKFGVHLYPTSAVVGRDGKIAFSSVSNQRGNPYWIKKTIDAALASPQNTTAAK